MSEETPTLALVDTNVFVYAYDLANPGMRDVAQQLIDRLTLDGSLAVSAQTLNEFYRNATRANRPPSLSHERAQTAVERIAAAAIVFPVSEAVSLRAVDAVGRYQMPIWDALIWAAARENGISLIYTEDVPGQPEIEGVRYINPFAGTP